MSSGRELTLEGLLSMTPIFGERDVVTVASRHRFLCHMRTQDPVKDTFFPGHSSDNSEVHIDEGWFDFEQFSVLFSCQTLCKMRDQFHIHTMLKEKEIHARLQEMYQSPDWKKIGFSLYLMLFPDLVKDPDTHIPFRAYMDSDRQYWARKLVEKVQDQKWVYSILHPIIRGQCSEREYNRDINILFVKLHLLNPTAVMTAYDYLRKALPDLNLELVTTNYLGGPLEWTLIKSDIEVAVNKPMYPSNVSKLSMNQYEVYYGVAVTEFIMQEPKNAGLWTGRHPQNRRESSLRDRCSVM